MKEMEYHAIGVIHSTFKHLQGMPIQPSAAKGVNGRIEIAAKYVDGLKHLQGYSHTILVYDFHPSKGYSFTVTPFFWTITRMACLPLERLDDRIQLGYPRSV